MELTLQSDQDQVSKCEKEAFKSELLKLLKVSNWVLMLEKGIFNIVSRQQVKMLSWSSVC